MLTKKRLFLSLSVISIIFSLSLFATPPQQTENNLFKFKHLTTNDGLSQNSVHSIIKDKYGFMWFGTWGGVSRYDGYSFKIFRACEDDSTALPDNRINKIIIDSLKNIWVYTGELEHLYRFNYETENFIKYSIKEVPTAITTLLNKNIKSAKNQYYKWEIDSLGLKQTNIVTKQQKIYKTNKNDPFSLSDNTINTLYIDDSDNLWIGTQNGGVNYVYLNIKPFSYYYANEIGNGLIDNVVRAITIDKEGKLWIGSEDKGITVIEKNRNGNKFIYYGRDQLIDLNIRSLYCDTKGFVWIGTKGGLDRFNPKTQSFKHYHANTSGSIAHPWVFSITEDHNGIIWIATFNGIATYNHKTDELSCLNHKPILKSPEVRAIVEDKKHNLWVATENGGVTMLLRSPANNSSETYKPKHYLHENGNENSLINNKVFAIAEDKYGMMWFGTSIGLSQYNPISNTFKHLSTKTGLSDDIIMGIMPDDNEHLWVSHKKGLSRIHIKTFEIRNYNNHDGLQGNEFTQNAFYNDTITSEMYFGGTNGLNSFIPQNIKDNKQPPHVILTGLKVLDQKILPGMKINNHIILEKSIFSTKEMTLTWWDKTFSIEFSAMHFANPLGNKYRYKLEGLDKQWFYTEASMRVASYSHIPAGNYTFKVYASNCDGIWSDVPAEIKIHVLPPWWNTWWAKIIYVIALLAIAWFIYKYITARIEFRNQLMMERIQSEKAEEINQMKLKFFTEISHEFRTPLTLIIDPLERLISDNPQPDRVKYYYDLMHRNAKQLLTLINQLLDFRKLEADHLTLNLEPTDLVEIIGNSAALFKSHAQERNITFNLHTEIDQLLMNIDIDKINMVMNNLLSNAFKFTPDNGEVNIEIQRNKTQVEIKVTDTGIGIPQEALSQIFDIFYQVESNESKTRGSGIGLALTKELINLHHGNVSVESKEGVGTCFTLELPLTETPIIVGIEKETTHLQEEKPTTLTNSTSTQESDLPLLLIVDDNADIRNYIESNLNTSYQIVSAVNGTEGIKIAIETIPDIIISDIMMPQISGIELCKTLKTEERTSHIPIILLTARQSDESKTEGYETGADAYITKPFNTTVLKAQVRNLLDQRQRLRELFTNGSSLEIKKIAINITDEAFLNKVTKVIDENMENTDFDTDILASKLKMSRSQLYRKTKALTNQSVHDFIITIRMNKALEYILSGEYSIAETAYKVGYSLPTNFTRSFVKQFGETPSKYIESRKK